jgi:hypothetical protein
MILKRVCLLDLLRGICGMALLGFVPASALEPERPVVPTELFTLLEKADKLVVEDQETSKKLFVSSEAQDRAELNDALSIGVPSGWFHCMCEGTPIIRLYQGGKEIGWITNHHGLSIRTSLWTSDAHIRDSEKWLRWFDARKINGPRLEFCAIAESQQKAVLARQKWDAAMPEALRGVRVKTDIIGHIDNLAPLTKALEKSMPEPKQRILTLLHWYGSGAGPWSGFYGYENQAMNLLMTFKTTDLLSAVDGVELSTTQTEGLARLLAGWDFGQERPNDLKLVPAELKSKLLKHALASDDKDKRGRARHAFEK